MTGQQIGDYVVLRRLGRGAMAEVYLAEQQSLARRVALKVLSSELADDASYVSRFQQEARSAAGLVHANIVQVYEVGCIDGAHFIAQEYVPGKNLGDAVHQQGRLKPGLVLDILRQSAAALHKAAEGGIVHRDIKPENLMLAESGEVKVADFGLARVKTPTETQLTQVGVTMGTPLYMSPEQIEGRVVDTRSDLYSLGVTAYHLLAGEPPFKGETPLSVAVQHLNNRAALLTDSHPDVPLRLSQIVQRLMAKKPEQRYQTPGDLLADLRELASQAAAEGWAEGPDSWTAPEMLALRGGHATLELDSLMKQAGGLSSGARSRGKWAVLVLGMLALGALVGAVTQPKPLLQGARETVKRKDDVLSQIFQAKHANTEAAWLAVRRNFPDLDISHALLADQGLARYYLSHHDFDRALEACMQVFNGAAEADQAARQFAAAGLTICFTAQGEFEKAQLVRDEFDYGQNAELEALEPMVARMFKEAVARLDEAT